MALLQSITQAVPKALRYTACTWATQKIGAKVADVDWMSLVSTAIEDRLPWLTKMVHDHGEPQFHIMSSFKSIIGCVARQSWQSRLTLAIQSGQGFVLLLMLSDHRLVRLAPGI